MEVLQYVIVFVGIVAFAAVRAAEECIDSTARLCGQYTLERAAAALRNDWPEYHRLGAAQRAFEKSRGWC